jgi:hypothetical protein
MTPRVVFGLLLLLSGVQLAYSKGSPDLIVIGGGGLIHQIDITDPAALKEFDHGGTIRGLDTESARRCTLLSPLLRGLVL